MKISRRHFTLASLASIGALSANRAVAAWPSLLTAANKIPGEIVGVSSHLGHKLRGNDFPPPSQTLRHEVVIVGGGIAGLAAGYRLSKAGANDVLLLELEKAVGGNSSSGNNAVTAYPWGAHYVPLVTGESTAVKRLFEELGIITGYNPQGLPIYNEFYLCADPAERLYLYGRWQEGLVPNIALSREEQQQYQRFFSILSQYKTIKGADGKKVFAIPVDKSSQDAEWLGLDEMTMEQWLDQHGYTSPHLRWYVNYCCRDDFGSTLAQTSAWAGLHYFASRSGKAANTHAQNVITWPEGNGWLARQLAAPLQAAGRIRSNALAYHIQDKSGKISVDYWDSERKHTIRIETKAVIVATPRFVAARLLDSDRFKLSAAEFSYSPWAVANITLGKLPGGAGAPLSWDNVAYHSNMLGYVVATHQIPQMSSRKTVITYYWPLSHLAPDTARREAQDRSYTDWQQRVVAELLNLHPELQGHIERVDICLWGHAMVRPTQGFIWGKARRQALKQYPPIFFAHSDMSGISLFEEAYTHGATAAARVISHRKSSRKKST